MNLAVLKLFSAKVSINHIANGLHYLNNTAYIAHQDLKPGNILVTEDRTVKIANFGSSGKVEPYARALSKGTLHYLSSDGLEGIHLESEKQHADKCYTTIDMYAFGWLIWELVSGYPPPKPSLENKRFTRSFLNSRQRTLESMYD